MGRQLDDVTLYVPARNAAAWLSACAQAIARLDPAPREVLIVYDDRSTDDTVAIARALPGVTAIAQPRPGLTAARNTAFAHARTRWVASVDSDVLVAPDWLGALWQACEDLGEPAALSGRTEERITQAGDAFRALMMPHHWGAHVMRGPFMTISDALFDRDAVRAVGGYRESLERYGDDSRLSQDLRDAGYALAYTPHARALHIRTDSVASVLDLRWSYSEPRQRARLMDLGGLRDKLAVNTEYGRMACSRALEAGEPILAAIGALLPWHHALRDCETMLAQRTLLDRDAARQAWTQLRDALWNAIARTQPSIAMLAGPVLPALKPTVAQDGECPWPHFRTYVAQVIEATRSFCAEVAPTIAGVDATQLLQPDADVVARWARVLGGPEHADAPGRSWRAPRSAAPWRDHEPQVPIDITQIDRSRPVALERFAMPHVALRRVVQGADKVALSYTMPTRIEAGTPTLLAVDLAEACAAEGLVISGFKTLAGGVELWAQRRTP